MVSNIMPKALSDLYVGIFKLSIVFLACCFIGCNAQSCLHNQFRCSDGRCINTEALCNGRRECPGGEDERGTTGWNCRSQVLAKGRCNPENQFRCRFGGCIPRSSLCNGVVECWGGSDESVDVCQGKPSVPISNNYIPQRPQQLQPTSRPTPTRAPPARQPIEPAPGSGIYGTAGPIIDRHEIPSSGTGACGPIREDQSRGFKVTCETRTRYSVNCDDTPEGGAAVYKCRNPFFQPTNNLVIETTRSCSNGKWSKLNSNFGCEAECGVAVSEQATFIVGGITADEGRWPWVAAMYELSSKTGSWEFICGASLISSRAVITAAHCVVRAASGQTKPHKSLKIVLGKYYRNYNSKSRSGSEQEFDVGDIYVNPEYNRVTLNNDVAIIKLSRAVVINEYVRPVCLPGLRDYIEGGAVGTLVGWGRGSNSQFKEQLQQAQLPFVPSINCIDAHPQFARLVHQGTFCAGYLNGTSACDGDSGGPLVFRDKYVRGKYILHGVVSAGIAASDGRSGCNPNYYTVFTNVGFNGIRSWIGQVISLYFQENRN